MNRATDHIPQYICARCRTPFGPGDTYCADCGGSTRIAPPALSPLQHRFAENRAAIDQQPAAQPRRCWSWLAALTGVAVFVVVLVMQQSGNADDPDRQARIDRMGRYQAQVDGYLDGFNQRPQYEQEVISQAVAPIVRDMCALAPNMREDDISTMAQFTMRIYRCWDELTHVDP